MKRFKLVVWIVILIIIQTILSQYVEYNGVIPNVLFAFSIVFAVLEERLSYVTVITLITGVISAAVSGREFGFVMIMFIFSAMIIYSLNYATRTWNKFIKSILAVLIFTAVGETLIYMLTNLTIDLYTLKAVILPLTVANVILTLIIYPILKKTYNFDSSKSNLLIT